MQAVNLFWLFLILRIAKNYVFNAVKQDERSDNEEEDEDLKVGDAVGSVTAAVKDGVEAAKEEVRRRIEVSMESPMQTDGPAVLLNGKPAGGETHPKGAMERKKKR